MPKDEPNLDNDIIKDIVEILLRGMDLLPNQERMLVEQARAGDTHAVAELYDAYTPKLYGYLVGTVRDRERAEDLLQTTWLQALEALPRYEYRGVSFGAWLFAIARNECRMQWRKSGREVSLEAAADLPDTQATLDHRDARLLVDRLVATLSADEQELLRLRYLADLSTKEVARVLGASAIATRVRIHRIIKKLSSVVSITSL